MNEIGLTICEALSEVDMYRLKHSDILRASKITMFLVFFRSLSVSSRSSFLFLCFHLSFYSSFLCHFLSFCWMINEMKPASLKRPSVEYITCRWVVPTEGSQRRLTSSSRRIPRSDTFNRRYWIKRRRQVCQDVEILLPPPKWNSNLANVGNCQ